MTGSVLCYLLSVVCVMPLMVLSSFTDEGQGGMASISGTYLVYTLAMVRHFSKTR